MKYAFRMFGVGGLFGYFGKFSNYEIGNMTFMEQDKMRLLTSMPQLTLVFDELLR